MKSVRRNAELTSFTFYTSAVAHIINIIDYSYSSSLRQHMGRDVGCRGEGRRTESRGGIGLLATFLGMGNVEYKFIYEMSFLLSENFTCNYCCVAFITASL